jgi:hypothetical protein
MGSIKNRLISITEVIRMKHWRKTFALKNILFCICIFLIGTCIIGNKTTYSQASPKRNIKITYSQDNPGYLGMSLPADFNAFTSTSPWNTPIPSKPSIDSSSKSIIKNLKSKAEVLKGSFTGWTIPLFVIDSQASPKRNIKTTGDSFNPDVDPDRDGIAVDIPIPEGVWPDPKTDGHMLLIDPYVRKSWDFSRAQHLSDGSWTTSGLTIWDLDGPGYREPFSGSYWWNYGVRGSGFPLIAGLIRPEEIEAGEVKHALVFASPINQKSRTAKTKQQVCSPPASKTDGYGIGSKYILEGARLQLDPNLDLDSLNLSPATKVIARAMQKYGMYNGDNSTDFKIYFQNLGTDGGKWRDYNFFEDLKNIPIDKFMVLKCNIVTKQ